MTKEETVDPRTGEIKERLKWFWLPRALIEIQPSFLGEDYTVVIMPEFLARDKGLI